MIPNFNIKDITDVKIENRRVLLRTDYNVSYDSNLNIIDDFRIRKSLPTLQYLLERKNKLIIISHLGKPQQRDKKNSFQPVAVHLQQLLPDYKIILINDFTQSDDLTRIKNQKDNEIILLENIRYYPGEINKDENFAKKLASLADIYVNDAFGESHRDVTSITIIPKYLPSYAGLLLKNEVEKINSAVTIINHPFTAIVGGVKISTKIKLIKKLLEICDSVIIGGALANNFFKAQNKEIGKSIFEDDYINVAKEILTADEKSHKLILPVDFIVADPDQSSVYTIKADEMNTHKQIFDIGPKSCQLFDKIIMTSKTIIWNGPIGMCENSAFSIGTQSIYNSIVNNPDAVSIIGGGDTLTFLSKEKNLDKITHISTGGGAMLKLIESGTLVGLEVLRTS